MAHIILSGMTSFYRHYPHSCNNFIIYTLVK